MALPDFGKIMEEAWKKRFPETFEYYVKPVSEVGVLKWAKGVKGWEEFKEKMGTIPKRAGEYTGPFEGIPILSTFAEAGWRAVGAPQRPISETVTTVVGEIRETVGGVIESARGAGQTVLGQAQTVTETVSTVGESVSGAVARAGELTQTTSEFLQELPRRIVEVMPSISEFGKVDITIPQFIEAPAVPSITIPQIAPEGVNLKLLALAGAAVAGLLFLR